MYSGVAKKLSIIIAAYNAQKTIADTIKSLQAIEHGWEYVEQLVICDDGSTDDTVSVINNSGFDRCNLTIARHDTNRGEAETYKTLLGILPAHIRWFLIIGHDDLALPCFIERNVAIVHQCSENVAAVSSNYIIFGSDRERIAHTPIEDVIVFRNGSKCDLSHTALAGCWWHISGSLVNRTLWEQFNGTDGRLRYCADWDLILRWQEGGFQVGHSLIPTTKFREHGHSLASASRLHFRDIVDRASIVKNYPTIFDKHMRRQWAGRLALTAIRRAGKQVMTGQVATALSGLRTCTNSVLELLNERNGPGNTMGTTPSD